LTLRHLKKILKGPGFTRSVAVVAVVGLLILLSYQAALFGFVRLNAQDHDGLAAFLESDFVISHRGALAECPENTLSGLEFAYEQGIRLIEIDVMMTEDNVPILFHDPSLDRTTNGTGSVTRSAWNYVRALDAGSWFSEEFAGERVPLMSEVFDWLFERPDLFLWVHLRFDRGDADMSALIKQCEVESQVVVQVDAYEVERFKHYQDCLGRACIIKEPLLGMVAWHTAKCRSYNVQFLTIMDVMDSSALYDLTDAGGFKVVLTRNFQADGDHVLSRLRGPAWGYVLDSAVVGGAVQAELAAL
jgi:hypothetical protein